MNIRRWLSVTLLAASCLLLPSIAVADPIVLGQIDTFESGTSEGWFTGGPNTPPQPASIATGGPAGAADHYMSLTSLGGIGPQSRLSVLNESQWAGNYIDAGVNAIVMDVNNLGTTDLYLRLVFEDPMFGPPSNVAFSTNSIFLPAGSGWTSVTFLIRPEDLTAGIGDVFSALTGATAIRLYHSTNPNFPNPVFPIPAVQAQLGVDNIRAAAIPEPATLLLLGTGLAGVVMRARKKRRL
jgi:PEP-CTERM motif